MSRSSSGTVDIVELGSLAGTLGHFGRSSECGMAGKLFIELQLAKASSDRTLIATNRLFVLGPTRRIDNAIRRIVSLTEEYRTQLLRTVILAVGQLVGDESVSDTLEQLDHLAPELLKIARSIKSSEWQLHPWHVTLWQSPDAITLLSKLVEHHLDIASLPTCPVVSVGFDWLNWDTPSPHPAPAPWADVTPLMSPLLSVRHPFWGALIATLDACTGDYEWQSLILRGGRIRSQHRTIGKAEPVIESLWREELGLYPVPPLVVPDDIPFVPGKPLHWLQRSLDHLAEAGIATESEGSWRLTDHFRTELMKDDEHMIAFEAVRQRSYRLATSAARITDIPSEVVAQ